MSGLTKALPSGRVLFENLELEVAPGECVAIMGESGVGKSTLLNLIAGLDQADSGEIRIDGTELGALNDDARTRMRREQIGFVFQAFHLLPHLNLEQNVALTLLLNRIDRHGAQHRAKASLKEIGLESRATDFPHQLSGGELQRVAIARALAHKPRLLLADEPTGNLDPGNAERVLALMLALTRKNGTASLLVTHSDAAARIADRRLELTPRGFIAR